MNVFEKGLSVLFVSSACAGCAGTSPNYQGYPQNYRQNAGSQNVRQIENMGDRTARQLQYGFQRGIETKTRQTVNEALRNILK